MVAAVSRVASGRSCSRRSFSDREAHAPSLDQDRFDLLEDRGFINGSAVTRANVAAMFTTAHSYLRRPTRTESGA